MARHAWKRWAMAGVLGAASLVTACTERQDAREVGKQVGQETERAVDQVREGAKKAAGELREGAEGFREGYGGSGRAPSDPPPREQR